MTRIQSLFSPSLFWSCCYKSRWTGNCKAIQSKVPPSASRSFQRTRFPCSVCFEEKMRWGSKSVLNRTSLRNVTNVVCELINISDDGKEGKIPEAGNSEGKEGQINCKPETDEILQFIHYNLRMHSYRLCNSWLGIDIERRTIREFGSKNACMLEKYFRRESVLEKGEWYWCWSCETMSKSMFLLPCFYFRDASRYERDAQTAFLVFNDITSLISFDFYYALQSLISSLRLSASGSSSHYCWSTAMTIIICHLREEWLHSKTIQQIEERHLFPFRSKTSREAGGKGNICPAYQTSSEYIIWISHSE